MIQDGSENGLDDNHFHKVGSDNQNLNSFQSQSSEKREAEKPIMETEGRTYSELYRNSSEEMFLKSLMENSLGMAAPTMESLGFKNLSHNLRGDSEELFNSWLMNGEGYNSTSIAHRTRQSSRRISTELAALSSQQHGGTLQNRSSNDNLSQQNLGMSDELSSGLNQRSLRNTVEKGIQASNLHLAKAWFQSSQPMTRSRSSELRRRYAAMQSFQTSPGMVATHNIAGRGINRMTQEFSTRTSFCDVSMGEMSNQLRTFMSPSTSSASPFCNPPTASVDAVSSVVSMLKGTLERKKLSNHVKTVEGSSFGFNGAQEVLANMNSDQGAVNQITELSGNFQVVSPVQVKDFGNLQPIEESIEIDIEDFVSPSNPLQMTSVSQEPSQSESSAAAPVLSTGFEACDGPANSGQTLSVCESSRKYVGNGGSEHGSKSKELRERIFENNINDERKKGNLVRMGSVTSVGSVDKGDPTKKRRVERSRKMAEAKERNQIPAVPSDMQSILKRCENLEKEVRSLKLNLSFMNRKDSEQTKQIEELQKQNEDLVDEKERLLEEIERILTEPGKM
ncbi:protein CYCLOPS-like [Tasmannia lanceolata]|uniref:protein CYCLOPS-like n=1 Tax=Tasmannia lanceolata TaxID=3420 RepID=UPI004063704E